MIGKEETRQSREDDGIPPRFFVVHRSRTEGKRMRDIPRNAITEQSVNSTENSRTADRTSNAAGVY